MRVSVLDYGAGNVRSLLNALHAIGCEVDMIETAEQIAAARVLIFPGVGAFGCCIEVLEKRGWVDALRAYVRADKPYFGICLGLQTLFEASAETPGLAGLGLLPGTIERFSGVRMSTWRHARWDRSLSRTGCSWPRQLSSPSSSRAEKSKWMRSGPSPSPSRVLPSLAPAALARAAPTLSTSEPAFSGGAPPSARSSAGGSSAS